MQRRKENCGTPRIANQLRICIVDPEFGDYQTWGATAHDAGAEVVHVLSAADALRLARSENVELWVVNCTLPDLAGGELCSMLKAQFCSAAVCLVADEYATDLEQAAHAARATLFTCKPGHHEVLDAWLAQAHRTQRPSRPLTAPGVPQSV